jgi:energy-coupling factor transport system ATP-binding protein
MRLVLEDLHLARGDWQLAAPAVFSEGIHLVCGNVGSGKSTLALAMAGLFSATSGSICRDGISSSTLSFQFPEYHITGLTLAEECRSWGLDPAAVLAPAGFADREYFDPFRLSRGELKRLHLACVLSRGFDLLILDEPFSSLDICEKMRVAERISGRTRGITILFTHEQAVFPRVSHIWEIVEGRLRYCGAPPEGLRNWQLVPAGIRSLIEAGRIPGNIAPRDLKEAACRT